MGTSVRDVARTERVGYHIPDIGHCVQELTKPAERELRSAADKGGYAMNDDGNGESNSPNRLSRRDFLARAGALGVALPFAGGLLDSVEAGASETRQSRRRTGSSTGAGSSKGLVIGLATDIDTLDPISFRSTAAYETVIQAYQEPVTNKVVTSHGILEGVAGALVPSLASKFSISPDASVYTFTVRPGAKFSNGMPVTAADFQYSYTRALEGPGYASLLVSLLGVKDASQFKVTGPMTFEVHLSAPNPMGSYLIPLSVLVIFNETVSKEHATSSDPWATDFYRTHMVGTGPYIQSSTWQPGVQYLLERNPHYWNNSQVKNSGVLMKYIPDEDDRALLVEQGAIDVAFGLPASKLHSLRSSAGVKLINTPSRSWNYLGMNTKMKPFDDVRVRQAIAYAMPYDELIQSALYGFASPLKGILATGTPTLDTSVWPYKTDVDKAKQLLAKAGYPKGFSSTLSVSVSKANTVTCATYIQAALAKVGITVKISQLSTADFRTKTDAGELPMVLTFWYSWVDDPFYQMYWLLDSKNAEKGGSNFAKFTNATIDKLITTGFYESNATERARLSREVQTLFAQQVPYVPLYSENFSLAVGKQVQGLNLWPDEYVRFSLLSKS